MTIKRITVCALALMICMQTPVRVSAAGAAGPGAGQETVAVEGQTAQEQSEEEQAVEGHADTEQTAEETAPEGTASEGTASEEAAAEDTEDVTAEKTGGTEKAVEKADVKEAGTVTGAGAGKEQAESEEVTEEIIESEAASAEDQNSAADALTIPTTWTVTGWHRFGAITLYVKQNLTLARGITKVGSVKYIFDPVTGQLRTGLVTISGATYLADSNGKMLTGWRTVNKKRYYFTDKHYSEYKESNEGKRLSGFVCVGGHRYYLMNANMKGFKEANFAVRATGWVTVKGYTYYCDPQTSAVVTGFQTIGDKRYYFSNTGVLLQPAKEGFREVEGKRYYFNADHSIRRGMSTINGARYYLNSETGEVMCGWKTINGRKYYFADERYRSYNKSIRGQRLTGFKEISGKTYYFINSSMEGYNKADYASRATGFKTINGKMYHFGADGVMSTGWQTIDGHKYHFSDKGVMDDGWTVILKRTYYFAEGKMATGWKTIDKKLYYFHKDGHKQECGRIALGGKMCAFDVNGVCRSKNSSINDVVQYALKWEGRIGYKSSATNTDPSEERKKELKAGGATDCSWFVFHCLARYGYLSNFVHSYEWGSKPSKYPGGTEIGKDLSKARAGDIICYAYGTPRTSKNSHVSIYLGNNKEIHCADGRGVIRSTVNRKDIIKIVRFGR